MIQRALAVLVRIVSKTEFQSWNLEILIKHFLPPVEVATFNNSLFFKIFFISFIDSLCVMGEELASWFSSTVFGGRFSCFCLNCVFQAVACELLQVPLLPPPISLGEEAQMCERKCKCFCIWLFIWVLGWPWVQITEQELSSTKPSPQATFNESEDVVYVGIHHPCITKP